MTKKYTFAVNKKTNKGFIKCRTQIDKSAIRHESIDGIEHIIVRSSTLPDDVVMNRKLYPAAVIESAYKSLELTFAPVEHPKINGQEVSAYDPRTIHEYYAGAYNMNVTRRDGRVWVDKYINVQEALKSEKGKRLLDRIDELENNSNPRPMHTSVGVFFESEILQQARANNQNEEYDEIITDMLIDHDAILLDSEGAATPDQGVGLALNRNGDKYQIENSEISTKQPQANQKMSFDEISAAVWRALEDSVSDFKWIEKPYDDHVIYEGDNDLFSVDYTIDDEGKATLTSTPAKVTKETNYIQANEGATAMKKMIINALQKAGIDTKGLTDEQLFEKHNEIVSNSGKQESGEDGDQGNQGGDQGAENNQGDQGAGQQQQNNSNQPAGNDVATIIANALKPLTTKIDGLESKLNESSVKEKEQLSNVIVNSDKYPGMTLETLKLIDIDTLKSMAANCQSGHGLMAHLQGNQGNNVSDIFQAPKEMPKFK